MGKSHKVSGFFDQVENSPSTSVYEARRTIRSRVDVLIPNGGHKMKRTILFLLFLGCTTVTPRAVQSAAAAPFPGRQFDHVLIVILENEDNETVLKNTYMKELAAGGRRFAHYDGLFHPSYPNYLALVAGDFFHTKADFQKTIDARTIADLLEPHFTWTQYAENYPGHCFLDGKTPDGLYARKHVPFLSFKSIQAPERCGHVVSAD